VIDNFIDDHPLTVLQINRLYTIDPKALNHIMMNHYIYQRPEASRFGLQSILGNGVLVVEEDKHKQQVCK
jgi:hypothetical protein